MMARTAAYGTWRSPITPELMTAKQVGLGSPCLDGGAAYWTESRPMEGGRATLLRRDAAGRVTAAADPDGTYTLTYDAAGLRRLLIEGGFRDADIRVVAHRLAFGVEGLVGVARAG